MQVNGLSHSAGAHGTRCCKSISYLKSACDVLSAPLPRALAFSHLSSFCPYMLHSFNLPLAVFLFPLSQTYTSSNLLPLDHLNFS